MDEGKTKILLQLGAAAAVVLYVLGFIAHNAYLLRFNYFEIEVFQSRYLVTGALIAIMGGIWWFFVGRAIYRIHDQLKKDFDKAIGRKLVWLLVPLLFGLSYARIAMLILVAVSLLSPVLFYEVYPYEYFALLVACFLVVYTIDTKDWDIRFPLSSLMVERSVSLVMVIGFFLLVPLNHPAVRLFFIFLGLSFIFNFVMDSRDRYKVDGEKNAFDGFFGFVQIFLFAVTLGSSLFDQIRPLFGGGAPIDAELVVTKEYLEASRRDAAGGVNVKILYESPGSLLVREDEKIFRIQRTAVLSVATNLSPTMSERQTQSMLDFVNRWTSAVKGPDSTPDRDSPPIEKQP